MLYTEILFYLQKAYFLMWFYLYWPRCWTYVITIIRIHFLSKVFPICKLSINVIDAFVFSQAFRLHPLTRSDLIHFRWLLNFALSDKLTCSKNIILRQLVDAPLVKPAHDLSDSSQAPPLYRHFAWVCKTHPPVIYAISLFRCILWHNAQYYAVASSNF